jgi:molybdopterin/thiamine biosynthesis adenylyltransferase
MSDLADDRDVRLQQMELIGPEGLARLRASRVAIVGAGNVGGAAALHVAQLGIPVTLIDRDRVGPENLRGQGFSPDQIGQPKTMARVEALRRLNPDCQVTPIHAPVESLGLGALRGVDLILAALDSNRARIALNEIAMRLGIAWLDAAIDGSGLSYTARVAMYPGGPGGACFLCAHDTTSIQALAGADRATTGCPTWWERRDPVTPPTLAVSALGTAAGAVQVIWAIEFLLGRGRRLAGREAHFDLGLMAMRSHRLPMNPRCLLDHRAFPLTPIGGPVDHVSIANTFRIAESLLGSGASLRLNRRHLVTELNCATCGETRHPYRVLEAMTEEDARCRAGHLMAPLAFGLRDRLERHELAPAMGSTWGELGLPSEDVVTAVLEDAEVHLLFAPSPGSSEPGPDGFHGEEAP